MVARGARLHAEQKHRLLLIYFACCELILDRNNCLGDLGKLDVRKQKVRIVNDESLRSDLENDASAVCAAVECRAVEISLRIHR